MQLPWKQWNVWLEESESQLDCDLWVWHSHNETCQGICREQNSKMVPWSPTSSIMPCTITSSQVQMGPGFVLTNGIWQSGGMSLRQLCPITMYTWRASTQVETLSCWLWRSKMLCYKRTCERARWHQPWVVSVSWQWIPTDSQCENRHLGLTTIRR